MASLLALRADPRQIADWRGFQRVPIENMAEILATPDQVFQFRSIAKRFRSSKPTIVSTASLVALSTTRGA